MDRARRRSLVLTRIRVVERTGSTNADMLADLAAREGDWLIAKVQAQGRGRQGRAWQDLKGNFAGTALVELRDGDPQPQTLSFAAGLALIEAVDVAAPGRATVLKWPNDLLLDGGKLAGILLEREGNRIAVGFGVNLSAAPAVAGRATAALDGAVLPEAFAPLLAASFARLLLAWRTSDPGLFVEAWLRRAHPIGTRLEVHLDPHTYVEGKFESLDPDGALRLRTDHGAIETVRAGDVEL